MKVAGSFWHGNHPFGPGASGATSVERDGESPWIRSFLTFVTNLHPESESETGLEAIASWESAPWSVEHAGQTLVAPLSGRYIDFWGSRKNCRSFRIGSHRNGSLAARLGVSHQLPRHMTGHHQQNFRRVRRTFEPTDSRKSEH